MTQQVRVIKCNADGTAEVIHVRQSACSGDCHKCSGCGAAKETMIVDAVNAIGAQRGDLVVIQTETKSVMKAVGVFYALPLVLFFLGYYIGATLMNAGALIACLGFLLGIATAVVYDRKVAQKENTVHTITGYAGDYLLRSVRKGDNEP
jgi:sigma-E factor negative regulatory protein RseC